MKGRIRLAGDRLRNRNIRNINLFKLTNDRTYQKILQINKTEISGWSWSFPTLYIWISFNDFAIACRFVSRQLIADVELLMKTCVLRLHAVCHTAQPVRTKVRYNSAKSQQVTSSTTAIVKNEERKFAKKVCDSFVEFMVRKHQEELKRLSTLIREEAIQRHNSYLRVIFFDFRFCNFLAPPKTSQN